MLQIVKQIKINVEVDEVFNYITNFSNRCKFFSSMEDSRPLDDGPISVGTRFISVAGFMNRSINNKFVVTEYVKNRVIASRSISGLIPIENHFAMIPLGEQKTAVTFTFSADPSPLFKIGVSVLVATIDEMLTEDMNRLKDILEWRSENSFY